MAPAARPLLLAAKGGGSAIVECLLTLAGIDYEAEYLEGDRLREIPTPCLADGLVLTEAAAGAPRLGDQRPGTAWFRTHCPKLHAVAAQVARIEALQPVWQRNGITPA